MPPTKISSIREIEKRRGAELVKITEKITDAERRLEALREERDSLVTAWADDGMTVAAMAEALGLTRQAVYGWIERQRRREAS